MKEVQALRRRDAQFQRRGEEMKTTCLPLGTYRFSSQNRNTETAVEPGSLFLKMSIMEKAFSPMSTYVLLNLMPVCLLLKDESSVYVVGRLNTNVFVLPKVRSELKICEKKSAMR